MNRRGFLRGLLTSTAAVVVAPACVMDELDELLDRKKPPRTLFDMGRERPAFDFDKPLLLSAIASMLMGALLTSYGDRRARRAGTELALQSVTPLLRGATP